MTYAIVGHVAAGSLNGNDVTTGTLDTTGANSIKAVVSCFSGIATPTTISDSKVNTYTPRTNYTAGFTGVRIFDCLNPTVGSGHTFTTSQSSSFPAIAVIAVSGAKASSDFDAENGNTGAGGSTVTTNSLTPSENNELVISGLAFYAGGTITIDSSFTIAEQVNYNASNSIGVAIAWKVQTSAGAENPTWTHSGTFTQCSADIACYKAAAGGAQTYAASANVAATKSLIASSVIAAAATIHETLAKIASSVKAASATIHATKTTLASSIIAATAHIAALADETASSVHQAVGEGSLSAAATLQVLTNLVHVTEHLQAAETLIASSVHSGTALSSHHASLISSSLVAASEHLQTVAQLTVPTNRDLAHSAGGASATIAVTTNLTQRSSHIGASVTLVVQGLAEYRARLVANIESARMVVEKYGRGV